MKTFLVSARFLLVLTLLTGGLYPLLVTGIARVSFPHQAEGSLLNHGTNLVGSALFSQRTTGPTYFWPRPSAGDDGTNYVTVASSASNKGPTAGDWTTNVLQRIDDFRKAHALAPGIPVPADMVFASGSGLDPHISPASARIQLQRVATARKLDAQQRQRLDAEVEARIEPPTLGFLGEPRINVLQLNLAVDAIFKAGSP